VAYYTDFICVQRVFDNEHVAGSQGHLILGIIYERGPIRYGLFGEGVDRRLAEEGAAGNFGC
jgi:hypothetical protein